MAKFRQFLAKPAVTAVLLVLAVALLGSGGVGSARAALNQYSEYYDSEVVLPEIDVTLLENGQAVSGSDVLLNNVLSSGEKLHPGKKYDLTNSEKLTVYNSGSIEAIVRVTVQQYWKNPNGEKAPLMKAEWIDLGLGGAGWTIDGASTTKERTVLYYDSFLPPGGETASFLKSITVNSDVTKKVTQTNDGNGKITTTYDYNGYQMCIRVKVDAVQTHNAADAVKSAWGKSVTVSGSSITLN